MNTMFLKMSRPGYKNREAFGFINDPPYCKPPRLMKRLPKEVRDRDIVSLIHALSEIREYPKYVEEKPRPLWWKSLVLFTATTAVRRGVIFHVKWDAFDLERNISSS